MIEFRQLIQLKRRKEKKKKKEKKEERTRKGVHFCAGYIPHIQYVGVQVLSLLHYSNNETF